MYKINSSHPALASTPAKAGIALLEDNAEVALVIMAALQQGGWDCQHYQTIAELENTLKYRSFDLLILDWSLPDGESDRIIRWVRQWGDQPPILVESISDDETQIVNALALGADDYVVKPLRISELQARIAALLRRSRATLADSIQLHAYRIDVPNRRIYLHDEDLALSGMEFDLGLYLFTHRGELLSRKQLLSEVWERCPEVDTRTVDAHVSRLRKKLRIDDHSDIQICTLRGYGYRLESKA